MKAEDRIDDTSIASRGENMIAADVADEAVLLDIDTGYFFQLNKSASQIWSLLETPLAISELCARLEAKFAVEAATCRNDVIEFVADMRDKGLVEIKTAA